LQILTDTGADFHISEAERAQLKIHVIPQLITLDGHTYRSGVDIQMDELYHLFETSPSFPTTSLPAVGDFVDTFKRMARQDAEIVYIGLGSALSGTFNAAAAAAQMVKEARITLIDSRTVSIVQGWQVVAAARAALAGKTLEQIHEIVTHIEHSSRILFTLKDLRYLVHGGRVSQLRGALASALQIKPLIGVDKASGKLAQVGIARTFSRAVADLASFAVEQYGKNAALKVEIGHTRNLEGALLLREHMSRLFHCDFLPDFRLSAVLGAHGGPTLVGMACGPQDALADL
jgi:DegV family protein with EDD domain